MTSTDPHLEQLERDLERAFAAPTPALTMQDALHGTAAGPGAGHPPRLLWRFAGAGALAAGLVSALAFLPGVLGGAEPVNAQELVNRSAQATAALNAASENYHLVYVSRGQGLETVTETWSGGSNRYRTESITTFSDGSRSVDGSVTIGDESWFFQGPPEALMVAHGPRLVSVLPSEPLTLDQLLRSWTEDRCFSARVTGKEQVAGRSAHVVQVRPTPHTCPYPPKQVAEVTLWIDSENDMTLQMRMEGTESATDTFFGVTLFETFDSIPDEQLSFVPPPGSTVVEYESPAELKAALGGAIVVPRGSAVVIENPGPAVQQEP